MHKNGLPLRFLTNYFDDNLLNEKSPSELFDLITEKAGFEYAQVIFIEN